MLLLSCDTDIYLLKVNYEEPSLSIFRSEPRRSRSFDMSPRQVSENICNVAVYDEDGVELICVDRSSENVFIRHLRGEKASRSGGKVAWLDDKNLIITEKNGCISVLDTDAPNSIWIETVHNFCIPDLPYSICRNPEQDRSMLISSMLGAIYRLDY